MREVLRGGISLFHVLAHCLTFCAAVLSWIELNKFPGVRGLKQTWTWTLAGWTGSPERIWSQCEEVGSNFVRWRFGLCSSWTCRRFVPTVFPLSQSTYRMGSFHDFGFHMTAVGERERGRESSANPIGLNEGSAVALRCRPGLFWSKCCTSVSLSTEKETVASDCSSEQKFDKFHKHTLDLMTVEKENFFFLFFDFWLVYWLL